VKQFGLVLASLAFLAASGTARAAAPVVGAMETDLFALFGPQFGGQGVHSTRNTVYPGFMAGGGALVNLGRFDGYAATSYSYQAPGPGSNRAEARLGLGTPVGAGDEVIPYLAFGYQCWNQTLLGGGARLDVPLTGRLAASVGVEVLALTGGAASASEPGTPQEQIELGFDELLFGPLHVRASAYLDHGSPQNSDDTAGGVNLGLAYSFY